MVSKTRKRSRSQNGSGDEEETTEYTFDPGTQHELEVEDTCCVTGEPVESSFCRFPDYRNGTLMVMSKKVMIEHLRNDSSIAKFKEILVERHGEEVLEEYYSSRGQ